MAIFITSGRRTRRTVRPTSVVLTMYMLRHFFSSSTSTVHAYTQSELASALDIGMAERRRKKFNNRRCKKELRYTSQHEPLAQRPLSSGRDDRDGEKKINTLPFINKQAPMKKNVRTTRYEIFIKLEIYYARNSRAKPTINFFHLSSHLRLKPRASCLLKPL